MERRYAVVGGLAVSVRSDVRFTRDVDLVLDVRDDADAEALVFALRADGYVMTATIEQAARHRLAAARVRDPDGVGCDLMFASNGIEREIVSRATSIEVVPGVVVPVARVEELLAMKVLAACGERPQDRLDVLSLVEFNPGYDGRIVRDLLTDIERRGYAREQSLVPKFEAMLAGVPRG